VTDHAVPIGKGRWSWLPPILDSRLEDFIRVRHMVPHGDRRYRAESCGAKDQGAITPRNNCIMREFILHDGIGYYRHLDNAGRLPTAPAKDIGQGFQTTNLEFEVSKLRR